MTYDSQRASYDREHIYIVEVDLDYCPYTHGISPCTATETGDDKCYNTLATCNDLANYQAPVSTNGSSIAYSASASQFLMSSTDYVKNFTELGFQAGDIVVGKGFFNQVLNVDYTVVSVANFTLTVSGGSATASSGYYKSQTVDLVGTSKTYRFCEARSPHPIGIDAIPSLKSVSLTPAKVDYTGGIGERSSVTLTFDDHPHNDLDIDKYTADRSYIASDRGLFWAKLRARNPNYQFRNLRVLTGYLENGEYKAENFKARHYVIEKLDASDGRCTIVGKDELKKASDKKAQVPAVSSGFTSAAITASDATPFNITLTPTGIGDAEYPASGYAVLSGSEIVTFTRSGDTLSVANRAQYNTTAQAHEIGVVVQLCYQKTAKIDEILYDLLTNYSNISCRSIYPAAWANEVLSNPGIDGNLSGLIAKPTDVNKVIKELAEAKPFSLYWDELNQRINFEVIKPPAETVAAIDMDNGLLADSVKVKDRPELRASTVYVTFGQINPTKSLTDPNNYTQTIVRVDAGSIEKYGSNQIKTITSRWITSNSKAVAENAAQLYGRRFADIPREVSFSVDPKDSDLKLGETRAVNHYSMTDFSGSPVDVPLQIISKQESNNFNYIGLEYLFADAITGDNPIDSTTIKFSINQTEVDLYTEYVAQFGTPGSAVDAVFEVESGVVIGSTSTANYALDTGSAWPSGSTIKLINNGYIVGKGGDAGDFGTQTGSNSGGNGGNAILLNHDLILINSGIIGGGGGGADVNTGATPVAVYGGGGAGSDVGLSGMPSAYGTLETGGVPPSSSGYIGGDLGKAASTGGSPGNAITENGYSLDSSSQIGDIRGAII